MKSHIKQVLIALNLLNIADLTTTLYLAATGIGQELNHFICAQEVGDPILGVWLKVINIAVLSLVLYVLHQKGSSTLRKGIMLIALSGCALMLIPVIGNLSLLWT